MNAAITYAVVMCNNEHLITGLNVRLKVLKGIGVLDKLWLIRQLLGQRASLIAFMKHI